MPDNRIVLDAPFNLSFDLRGAGQAKLTAGKQRCVIDAGDASGPIVVSVADADRISQLFEQAETRQNAAGVKISKVIQFSSVGPSSCYLLIHGDPQILVENAFRISEDSIKFTKMAGAQRTVISEAQAGQIADNLIKTYQGETVRLPEIMSAKLVENVWQVTVQASGKTALLKASVMIDATTGQVLDCRYF